ncbi:MAG TPA: hydantoinase/oxoprolinase family protein, partial [Solirubrobacteraceae bacterium]|nr:hydantoinase/oxoprolinase family protein [Solirubrobacteraceae bacterium]
VDPRDSTLIAGGGAAGLTILAIARELGCREVLVPRAAGVLSAFGGQHSEIVREMTAPHATNSKQFDFDGVAATLRSLRERMLAFEAELPRGLAGAVDHRYFVEARYAYQVWDLSIPLDGEQIADEAALARLIESFHDAHERIFAVREPGQKIELSQWKGRVAIETAKPPLAAAREPSPGDAPSAAARVAYFPELGEVEIPVHSGAALTVGTSVAGPALVIEPETTIVVYPGWTAHVSELGNYRLELAR